MDYMDNGLDNVVRDWSVKLTYSTSRRGFIAAIGKTVLALVAGSVAGAFLPVDRTVDPALASHLCTDSLNCGMHGYPCVCCGGSTTSCPSGTTQGSSWTACCISGGTCHTITYADCCYDQPCPYPQECCPSPSCPGCNWCTNSNELSWCNYMSDGRQRCYQCTLAIIGASCPAC